MRQIHLWRLNCFTLSNPPERLLQIGLSPAWRSRLITIVIVALDTDTTERMTFRYPTRTSPRTRDRNSVRAAQKEVVISMKLSLVALKDGRSSGPTISVLTPTFMIGRDLQCQLRPASALVSKRHCALIARPNEIVVRDFESANGTFVNGTPVRGEAALQHGDVLRVGPLTFRVHVEDLSQPIEDLAADFFSANDDDSAEFPDPSIGASEETLTHAALKTVEMVAVETAANEANKKMGENAQEAARAILSKLKKAKKSRSAAART